MKAATITLFILLIIQAFILPYIVFFGLAFLNPDAPGFIILFFVAYGIIASVLGKKVGFNSQARLLPRYTIASLILLLSPTLYLSIKRFVTGGITDSTSTLWEIFFWALFAIGFNVYTILKFNRTQKTALKQTKQR